jgi:hypothetical protein
LLAKRKRKLLRMKEMMLMMMILKAQEMMDKYGVLSLN